MQLSTDNLGADDALAGDGESAAGSSLATIRRADLGEVLAIAGGLLGCR